MSIPLTDLWVPVRRERTYVKEETAQRTPPKAVAPSFPRGSAKPLGGAGSILPLPLVSIVACLRTPVVSRHHVWCATGMLLNSQG